jgi:predicted O-methyltransferase YrrM
VLQDAFRTGLVENAAGESVTMRAHISARHANALFEVIVANDVVDLLEVGMAHGVSTLAVLTALSERGGERRLTSIDPAQRRYGNAALRSIERAGFGHLHRHVARPDHLALPELLESGTSFDFAYLDGHHSFDRTLLDFFYVDQMLRPGGVVGFNDCGYPSVHAVTRFVVRHRRHDEVDVGLPRRYVTRSPGRTAANVALRRSKSDRYFRKREHWEPGSRFWRRF